jgi:hypothetical protein
MQSIPPVHALRERFWAAVSCVTCLAVALGCADGARSPSAEGRRFLLDREPQRALSVLEAQEAADDAGAIEQLTVVGRVAGQDQFQWDAGQAAFLIGDLSLQPASEPSHAGHDDNCPFCQAKQERAFESMVLVQLVDDQGKPVAADPRDLLGVEEGQVIVAQGRGTLDDLGHLVVWATGIFVKR